jgi:hypothetical protein
MSTEYVNGNLRSRLVLFGFIGVLLLGWVYSDELYGLFIPDDLFKNFELLENDIKVAEQRLFILWLISAILVWVFAAYFIHLGFKLRARKQWPLPGMKMPFRTKVVHGKDTRDMQYAIFILGIFFLVMPMFGLYIHYKFPLTGG